MYTFCIVVLYVRIRVKEGFISNIGFITQSYPVEYTVGRYYTST
jgi:hypothetical protein